MLGSVLHDLSEVLGIMLGSVLHDCWGIDDVGIVRRSVLGE